MIIFANIGPKLASNIDSSNINFKMYAITVSFTLILSQSITSFCFADEWKTAQTAEHGICTPEIFCCYFFCTPADFRDAEGRGGGQKLIRRIHQNPGMFIGAGLS